MLSRSSADESMMNLFTLYFKNVPESGVVPDYWPFPSCVLSMKKRIERVRKTTEVFPSPV